MYSNEIHKNAKRKKRNQFASFLLANLKRSMITGIPGIVTADSIPKKLIRTAVFVTSLIGFIYQSLKFMEIYRRFETIVDVKVTTDLDTELPAFTICNYNGLLASEICQDDKFKDRCYEPPRKNDSGTGSYVLDLLAEVLPMPKLDYYPSQKLYKEISLWEFKEYEMFLTKTEDFLHESSCSIYFLNRKLYRACKDQSVRINCPHKEYLTASACWTANTIIGKPKEKMWNITGNPGYGMGFFIKSWEYPDFLKPARIQISVHNSRQVVNPFDQGFTIQNNGHETFQIKKVIKSRLPYPYDTNCTDYIEQWESRGGYGPTNQKECIYECQKNVSLSEYGCICQIYYMIPGNERRCESDKIVTTEMSRKINECEMEHCRPACYEESYEVIRDSGVNVQFFGCSTREDPLPPISIFMFVDGMDVIKYTHRPKYDSIEIFSYLGGYIGMWLGISLMGVYDLFELLFQVLMYPLKNYMASRKKLTRIQKICVKIQNE